jgi:acetylornithine deacetylase/succinyl-diaminopimelate desuccinylase-like protein
MFFLPAVFPLFYFQLEYDTIGSILLPEVAMRKVIGMIVAVIFIVQGFCLFSLDKKELLQKVRQYRKNHEHQIINDFVSLLTIPNVAADKTNIRKNAVHIKDLLTKHGVKSKILETAGNPVVYGELIVPGAKRTLLFYVHYDGQPVDSSKWTGSRPFKPVLRAGKLDLESGEPKPMPFPKEGESFNEDWRIYARSSSDDKAPVIALITALDALKQAKVPLKNNLKFIFEGEEEAGSPNLRGFLEKHTDLLKTDLLLMCDGPAYFSGAPTFFFGVRGIVSVEIKVYGAYTSLHSGHYGNWAPNPAMRLSQLLASMKDIDGKVLIDGFYDTVTPLSELEKQTIKEIPGFEEQLKKLYGFSGPENSGKSLIQSIQMPSFNVAGISSGWVGHQARTIVPSQAVAAIDMRLVKGCDPDYMVDRVIRHVKKQGYHVVTAEPTAEERMKYPFLAKVIKSESGYRASRTSMDIPISRLLLDSIKGYRETKPVLLPSLGGSLPIFLFEETLKAPVIGIPIVNYDNNQHQPDENLRIGHLWQGIETLAAVMAMGLD